MNIWIADLGNKYLFQVFSLNDPYPIVKENGVNYKQKG